MAVDPCARATSLTRAGLSQPDRHRAELARGHFSPDDRDLADLVLFGQRFARHLKYYDRSNIETGDWETFFASDISAALAALAKLPLDALVQFQTDVEGWLLDDPNRPAAALGSQFRLWFHLPLAVVEAAGRALDRLPRDHALALSAPVFAHRALAVPLGDLAGWFKGALPGEAGLFDDVPVVEADLNLTGGPGDDRPRVPAALAEVLLGRGAFADLDPGRGLSGGLTGGSWAAHVAAALADAAPYADAGTPFGQIEDALSYNLMSRSADRLREACARLQADAQAALAQSLTGFDAHAPQAGLWLAFLELFSHARAEMNGFTGRHLDFYLRDVLRLRPLGPVADHAHLTFELARGTASLQLPAGTEFGAGKDGLGKPVSFALDSDLVVNRARVAQLRGLRRRSVQTVAGVEAWVEASPDLLSVDGLGTRPLPPDTGFSPFGPTPGPAARLGFAVADRRLFLREGNRTITLRFEVSKALPASLVADLTVRLTAEEGWHEMAASFTQSTEDLPASPITPIRSLDHLDGSSGLSLNSVAKMQSAIMAAPVAGFANASVLQPALPRKVAPGTLPSVGMQTGFLALPPVFAPGKPQVRVLKLEVLLPPEAPPIVPLDPALHGTDHVPGLPVMEVIVGFATAQGRRAFAVLADLVTARPTLEVAAAGLRQVSVQAAGADVDPSKPFAPFGSRPRVGDALILGSSEMFSKPLSSWALEVEWLTPHSETGFFRKAETSDYTAGLSVLRSGVWTSEGSVPISLATAPTFSRAIATRTRITDGLVGVSAPGDSISVTVGSSGGTIGLGGADDVAGDVDQTVDNPAYDGTARSGFLRLDLKKDFGHAEYPEELTRSSIDLARGVAHAKAGNVNYTPATGGTSAEGVLPKLPYDPVITSIAARYVTQRSPVQLLRHLWPFGTDLARGGRMLPPLPAEAALFVGLEGFEGPARVTLLAEVENGTGDPLLPRPEFTFSRLGPEGFVQLAAQDVDDKSGGLTTSGVIGLALTGPEGAPPAPQMPAGLTWLQLSVEGHAAAVNRLRALVAQAGRATFIDRGNDPARLAAPLTAGSISRKSLPEPKLKTVAQPFAGFGGRPSESASAMDMRVAERLRHKDRGITMWDIEALVAQAFPQIYRVKCLGLTALQRNAAGVVTADNENRPGAVTVVAVPYVLPESPGDPLRPYLDQATLAALDGFLRPRLSPFVRLEVVNPRIEEVSLAFRVRFAVGIADTAFYLAELGQALVAHLTPWAGPDGGAVSFGGRLWKSTVIDFLDSQPYVDFVTDVQMFHKPDASLADGQWTPVDRDLIETVSARSVLVSAARHAITELPRGGTP